MLTMKIIFNASLLLCIYGSSFEWFSVRDNELVRGQPLMLVRLEIYSLKNAITHDILSM